VIVGASFDNVEAQKNFADEQGFPYRLLADTDKVMGAAYLADQPDKGYPRRISYLIDPGGTIVRTYDLAGQDLNEHASAVLEDIRALS
jgi:peroxiredoxin